MGGLIFEALPELLALVHPRVLSGGVAIIEGVVVRQSGNGPVTPIGIFAPYHMAAVDFGIGAILRVQLNIRPNAGVDTPFVIGPLIRTECPSSILTAVIAGSLRSAEYLTRKGA